MGWRAAGESLGGVNFQSQGKVTREKTPPPGLPTPSAHWANSQGSKQVARFPKELSTHRAPNCHVDRPFAAAPAFARALVFTSLRETKRANARVELSSCVCLSGEKRLLSRLVLPRSFRFLFFSSPQFEKTEANTAVMGTGSSRSSAARASTARRAEEAGGGGGGGAPNYPPPRGTHAQPVRAAPPARTPLPPPTIKLEK